MFRDDFLLPCVEGKLNQLKRDLDADTFERRMKRENAVELCVALGMNPQYVHWRFNAIDKLLDRMELPRNTTPTIVAIHHLIRRPRLKNRHGDVNDGWNDKAQVPRNQSTLLHWYPRRAEQCGPYYGCCARGNRQEKMFHSLPTWNHCDLMMKGNFFELRPEENAETSPIEYGSGFYCVQGHHKEVFALAVERSWPLLRNVVIESRNPAVRVFDPQKGLLWPLQKTRILYEVRKMPPFTNAELKRRLPPDLYTELARYLREYSNDRWKVFVKGAIAFDLRPKGPRIFFGRAADHTIMRGNTEPRPSEDGRLQFSFQNPMEDLRMEQLFVELNVDWSERGDVVTFQY